jgi:hypothetical protein
MTISVTPMRDATIPKKFELVSIASLIKNPVAVKFMVKGLIESGGMNLLSGEYSSGKSFLVFDLAFCVASGIDWHGHKVKQSPVVIIAGEGHQGIGNRLLALEQHYNIPTPLDELRISISRVAANFTDDANAQLVQQAVHEVCPDGEDGLVIIDTLNKNFGGANENETAQMTKFVNNLDTYFRNSGKTVIVVHHPNKSDPNSSRGSNALPGACEGVFNMSKDSHGQIKFWCSKQKNAKETPPQDKAMYFELEAVTFPDVFDDGEPVGSAFIVPVDKPIKSAKGKKTTGNDDACRNALSYLIEEKGVPISAEIKNRYGGTTRDNQKMIHEDVWQKECLKRLDVNSDADKDSSQYKDTQRRAFTRAKKSLKDKDIILIHSDYVWFMVDT